MNAALRGTRARARRRARIRARRCHGRAAELEGATLLEAEAFGKHLVAHFSDGRRRPQPPGDERALVRCAADGRLAVRKRRGCDSRPDAAIAAQTGGKLLRWSSESPARNDPGADAARPRSAATPGSTAAMPPSGLRPLGAGREIGEALLDQRIIAGDRQRDPDRGLFRARVSPWRRVDELESLPSSDCVVGAKSSGS